MDLSIVIPAYNEAAKIAQDITSAARFLQDSQLDGQIIVVDNGSSDNTTEIAESTATSPQVSLEVIRPEYNHKRVKPLFIFADIFQSAMS